jgi:hypothetical protein
VLYFGLYSLATQIAGGVLLLPNVQLPALGTVWPLRDVTLWLAEHMFGVTTPIVYIGNSGDTAFHWVQTALLLVLAAAATVAWRLVDRGSYHDGPLHTWFRVFLRFALAAQMFYYGMAKVIPTQFQAPSLVTLVEPVGNLSLADLLWTFIGASTPYQVATGCAEMAAGILLVIPRTATLGALICIVDMLQVFLLNMTYDFGLKQISFHLILMAAFLVAPDAGRLASVFVSGRAAEASTARPLFRNPRYDRMAVSAQIALGLYLIGMFTNLSLRLWYAEGGGKPKSPLYGIWDVAELSMDGSVRAPDENDYDHRWRRVIFDMPETVVFQRTDDSFAHYGATIDPGARSFALRKGNSTTWEAAFAVERPSPDALILEGNMDGHKIRARLRRLQLDTFRLLNSRFRWIRPPDPFAG